MRKLFKLLDVISDREDRNRMIQRMLESEATASADPDLWWRYGIGDPPDGWPKDSKKLSKAA